MSSVIETLQTVLDQMTRIKSGGGQDGDGLRSLATLIGAIGGFAHEQEGGDKNGNGFLAKAADVGAAGGAVDRSTIAQALHGMLIDHRAGGDLSQNEDVRKAVIAGVREVLKRRGVNVSGEEVGEALTLLQSGQFLTDLGQVSRLLGDLAPDAIGAVFSDLDKLPGWLVEAALIKGLLIDLRRDVDLAPKIGKIFTTQEQVSVPSEALHALYQLKALRTVGTAVNDLLGNKTVALALVIYANAHGARIDLGTIEAVRQSIFDVRDPNLGPLLREGAEY